MGVLKPSGNGLYFLQHPTTTGRLPSVDKPTLLDNDVALTAQCNFVLSHRRFGHLNMHTLHAQHDNGVPTSHALPSSVKNVSCDSCLLIKASASPRNTVACAKPPRPHMNMSSDIWGPVNVPFPHGLRHCLLMINHHTIFMWVRFLKSKDDTCGELESILLEVRHLYARYHSPCGAFAPVLTFDYDSVFEAAPIHHICGVGVLEFKSLHPTLTTCLERRSVPGVPFGTSHVP
jgi:hypothetical protein